VPRVLAVQARVCRGVCVCVCVRVRAHMSKVVPALTWTPGGPVSLYPCLVVLPAGP
jgi:hypothetical protein